MTPREEYNELLDALQLVDATMNIQAKMRTDLFEKVGKIFGKIVEEEQLLSKILWTTSYRDALKPVRDSEKIANDVAALIEARITMGRGYHWSFEIEPGCVFRSDDFDITINFDDLSIVPGFIQRHNLKVDMSRVDAEIEEAEYKLKTNREIKAIFDAQGNEETKVSDKEAEG